MEKIIHYCWFGDKPMPKLAQKCLKSWKKFLPFYKYLIAVFIILNQCTLLYNIVLFVKAHLAADAGVSLSL